MIPFFMNVARGIALAAFLLVGLLSQAQVVFACELMNGARQTQCCCGEEMTGGCEMGGGCERGGEALAGADCCVISVDGASELAASVAVAPKSPIILLNGPQPLPGALLAARNKINFPPRTVATNFVISRVAPDRTNIYFSTRRIRV